MNKKSQIPPSPFVDIRKERESTLTKIFVNYEDYPHWMSNKNCLIQGSRGTGKSSILTVFNFETRWFNKDIIVPSNELKYYFPEQPDIIGTLFKCEELEKKLWEKWSKKYRTEEANSEAENVFATFINYYFIEKIIHAIIEIRNKNVNVIHPSDNVPQLISDVLQKCYPQKDKCPHLYDHSLISLRDQLEDTHFSLRQQIYSSISYDIIEKRFCIHTPNTPIIDNVCKIITNHFPELNKIKFFLLIDDVDRLETWQIKVLNSILISIKEPCSFKLSSSNYIKTKISTNDRSLSNTDLHISMLNDDSESGSKLHKKKTDELFNAIFNIRIEKYFPLKYNVKEVFGSIPDIDKILLKTLETRTINPEISKLVSQFKISKETKITNFWLDYNNIINKEASQIKKENDKYRVSAVFSALIHYNLEKSFEYSSYDMISLISSGSPRHFIRICNRMWKDIYLSLIDSKFPINNNAQKNAIIEASNDLYLNLDDGRFDGQILVSYRDMCNRLGLLFKQMISIESLKITPECLSIQIDEIKISKDNLEKYNRIIDSLIMVEAIKIKRENASDTKIKIALNPMLAPYFCLPYRSPFSYFFTLEYPNVLLTLLTIESEKEANNLIEAIYNSRIKNDQSPTLFDS